MTTTYTIQGTQPRYSGTCVVCRKRVDAKNRAWDAVLLIDGDDEYAVVHARCAGGKYGGVKTKWRGPDTLTV